MEKALIPSKTESLDLETKPRGSGNGNKNIQKLLDFEAKTATFGNDRSVFRNQVSSSDKTSYQLLRPRKTTTNAGLPCFETPPSPAEGPVGDVSIKSTRFLPKKSTQEPPTISYSGYHSYQRQITWMGSGRHNLSMTKGSKMIQTMSSKANALINPPSPHPPYALIQTTPSQTTFLNARKYLSTQKKMQRHQVKS